MSTTVPPSSQRLIDAYLRDLEAASVDRDPVERAETIAAIRAHLDDALASDLGAASVEATLAELGDPSLIAQSMSASPVAAPAHVGEGAPTPPTNRPSALPTVLLVLAIAALAAIVVAPPLAPFVPLPVFVASLVARRGTADARGRARLATAAWCTGTALVAIAAILLFTLPAGGSGGGTTVVPTESASAQPLDSPAP